LIIILFSFSRFFSFRFALWHSFLLIYIARFDGPFFSRNICVNFYKCFSLTLFYILFFLFLFISFHFLSFLYIFVFRFTFPLHFFSFCANVISAVLCLHYHQEISFLLILWCLCDNILLRLQCLSHKNIAKHVFIC